MTEELETHCLAVHALPAQDMAPWASLLLRELFKYDLVIMVKHLGTALPCEHVGTFPSSTALSLHSFLELSSQCFGFSCRADASLQIQQTAHMHTYS